VRYPITAGQPLTTGALVSPGDRGFLAAALAPGMRAITITVSAKTGVGGFVFPGDRVDVMLTQSINGSGQMGAQNFTATETVLRNVRVLATDQSTDSEQVNGKTVVRNSQTVTVEVTPKVAEKIEVAQQVGTLSLSLRALADNAADLDRAIAKGQVQIDGTPGKGAAAFAAPRSNDSGTSVTTGAEVSRFQRASLPPAAPVAGPVAAPRSADGAAPAHNDHGVRVMRGRDSQSVTQSTLGLLGRGDGAGQVSAAAPGTSSASAGASQN
jgi:pilus assembly protein CpaB